MTAVTPARAAITLVFFLNGALFGAWAARIPAVQGRLGLGEGELAVALAFLAVGSLMAMPLAGRWAARAGSRRATRGLFLAFCAAVAVVTLAPSLPALCVGTFLVGASGGGLDVVMNAQGTTVERHSGRLVLSSLHAAFSAGGLAGAGIAALAAAGGVDVRVQLAGAAMIAAAAGLLATRHLLASETDAAPEGPSFARPDRGLWALGFVAFCSLLGEGAAADWSAVYLSASLGATPAVAALAFAGFSATMVGGRLLGDRLVARLGAATTLRAAGAIAALGLGAGLAIGTPAGALTGFALLGAGLSVIIPLVFRAASVRGATSSGPPLAAVATMGYFGILAGPPLVGALAELTSLTFALGVVALLVATPIALARPAAPSPEGAVTVEA